MIYAQSTGHTICVQVRATVKNWQNWISFLAVAVALGDVAYKFHRPAWTAHEIAGAAIMIPAFCLWALARVQLGSSFAVRAQAKQLVTRGLYAKIQNPVYLFGSIFIVGVIVFLGQPKWFLIFLVLIPMQLVRIRNERRVLEAKFGDAYREYRKRTWF
jgi:protein-S-isoprenylcysteine O-methyltransferase Ste14